MLPVLFLVVRSIGLMCRGHRAVALENLALRQQLAALTPTKRPQLRRSDRLSWILLVKSWRDWRTALVVVRPDTVVRWHREWFRRQWAARSRQRPPGRLTADAAIRTLVDKMGAANPLWGAPRISRLLRRRRRPPSRTWRTFLANHVASLVSMDFFTVPTLTGRVLFVLVLLSHHRRRIVHLRITDIQPPSGPPSKSWRPFPDDTAPGWLLRDRDAIYGEVFRRRIATMGIKESNSRPSSPWQSPYAERLIGSIRRECLDHVIVLNQRHFRHTLARDTRRKQRRSDFGDGQGRHHDRSGGA